MATMLAAEDVRGTRSCGGESLAAPMPFPVVAAADAAAVVGDGLRKPHEALAARVEKRRRNRAYMREWRADPANRERVRAAYARSNYARKLRVALMVDARGTTESRTVESCAFCRVRPATTQIGRLEISRASGKYHEVLVPYCGHC